MSKINLKESIMVLYFRMKVILYLLIIKKIFIAIYKRILTIDYYNNYFLSFEPNL